MKRIMLLLDFFIALVYLSSLVFLSVQDFRHAVVVMLYFVALRVLALALHPLISIFNLLLLGLLWDHSPSLLMLLYTGYVILYVYLYRREIMQTQLQEENTKLQMETKSLQRYQLLHHRYQEQLELNLRLDERRHIAQRIHDLLGHTIAAAILQLEASKTMIREDPLKAEAMVSQSAELLRHGMDQIRYTVKDMQSELQTMKFSNIELLVDRVRRDTDLEIHLGTQGDLSKLSISHWNIAYQLISEGLSNVIKHAQANLVTIEIQVYPKMLRFFLEDDGKGYEELHEGMGLRGIRERIEEASGTMIVDGHGGMSINCVIPFKGDGNDSTSDR